MNYWIVIIKPFAPKYRSEKIVDEYQEACIRKRLFGMGYKEEFKDEEIEKGLLLSEYKKTPSNKGAIAALNCYRNIHPGDLVLTRLKNGAYYIGRVKCEPYYCGGDIEFTKEHRENRFSWCAKVEKWEKLGDYTSVPYAIAGKMSQAYLRTIQQVKEYRSDKLTVFMQRVYERISGQEQSVPKIKLNAENFAWALDADALEDLVYEYMRKQNPNYCLIPSSCKKSTPMFEFCMTDATGKKITCQVKNQAEINISNYTKDIISEYEKVYLYSGKATPKQHVEKLEFISQDALFDTLKALPAGNYIRTKLSLDYDF